MDARQHQGHRQEREHGRPLPQNARPLHSARKAMKKRGADAQPHLRDEEQHQPQERDDSLDEQRRYERCIEELVHRRIEDLAQCTHLVPPPCRHAVEHIARAGDKEQDQRYFSLFDEQERNDWRNQHRARERYLIGE